MVREIQRRIVRAILVLFVSAPFVSAQNQAGNEEGLVRLMKASSIQLIENNGMPFRKAVDATFLHNGTYLICDTALWNVEMKIIKAQGNVQVIQNETALTSEKLDYYVDIDLAQFRGTLVQLKDKQNNILRTRYLDYNTKDSVAVFMNGGAMRDKDGQIIESFDGTYNSKEKRFKFENNVNMFTDSVFIKTSVLDYDSETSKAWFRTEIDFWKDGSMMSAMKGWYERPTETFFLTGKVHATTKEQESWSDSLYYYRACNNVLLLKNAQIQDTTRNVSALADRIYYVDSLSRITLSKKAAVAIQTEEKDKIDTLYCGADTLIYYTVKRCDVPQWQLAVAKGRIADMFSDPVSAYRQKAAKEAAAKAAQEAEENPNNPKKNQKKASAPSPSGQKKKAAEPAEPAESVESAESAEPADPAESATPAEPEETPESTEEKPSEPAEPAPDTTKIGFLTGIHNVKIFRKDIQVRADSLVYCDLDSIARFYINPIVWNDGNRQYTSDSLYTLVRNGAVDRASLLSNAFIVTREDSLCFDQIKATEVMAYFDTTAALKRFDALGGASAYFYLQEDSVFATMNKVESKMLSAIFKNGELDKVFYYESPKNDAYPVAQLPMDQQRMRGFSWKDDERPASGRDITSLELRPSERLAYSLRPKAEFYQADEYFPGYIESVYAGIERRDSLKRVRHAQREMEKTDVKDSLVVPVQIDEQKSEQEQENGQNVEEEAAQSSEENKETTEAVVAESEPKATPELSEQEKKAAEKAAALQARKEAAAAKKAAAEARRQEKLAARDARWAEMDLRDAEKAARKAERKLERQRKQTRKVLLQQQRQEAKDRAKLERYKAKYAAKKAKEDAREASRKSQEVTETILNENGKVD